MYYFLLLLINLPRLVGPSKIKLALGRVNKMLDVHRCADAKGLLQGAPTVHQR